MKTSKRLSTPPLCKKAERQANTPRGDARRSVCHPIYGLLAANGHYI